jgi:plasmid stabilization system protein ParE
MTVKYAPRAVRDLEEIGAYYRAVAGSQVAEAIADRIARVIDRLDSHPESAPRVADRPGIRVVLVRRYQYKIFYRLRSDFVEILHIRHTARRPWVGP